MSYPMSVNSYDDEALATKNQALDCFNRQGISYIITSTHAKVVECFTITMKNTIHDRARFNTVKWTDAVTPALNKAQSTHRQR